MTVPMSALTSDLVLKTKSARLAIQYSGNEVLLGHLVKLKITTVKLVTCKNIF